MISRTTQAGSAAVVGALTACGLLATEPAPISPQRAADATKPAARIVQVGFGHEARFMACASSDCPATTPKTLESRRQLPALPTPSTRTTPPDSSNSGPSTANAPTAALPELKPAAASDVQPPKITLTFKSGSAKLTDLHKASLERALLAISKSDSIVIAGRTDAVGTEARNQALALARGLAVRDHLLDLAPNLPTRISIDARGRCCYAAPNDAADGRARNRRVEVVARSLEGGEP